MQTRFVTVQLLGSGYAAVMMWLNTEDIPGEVFWEPWQTGIGRYLTAEEAEREALDWAWGEDSAFIAASDAGLHMEKIATQYMEDNANTKG
jgi:hypothetical protein